MLRSSLTILFSMTAMVAVVDAQTPKIPPAQARYCAIFENWVRRNGYAPGAEPKAPDPNPIKAAQAPKPADPGNIFDQLVDVFGTTGEVSGWKGLIIFDVQGQFVQVKVNPWCRDGNAAPGWFETDRRHMVPLKSPIADFLSNAKDIDVVTFSGHLFYNAGTQFYLDGFEPFPPRQGNRNLIGGGSPSQQYAQVGHSFAFEFTSVSK